MANYHFRRDEVVIARTQFLTPGGQPSTYREVHSVRSHSEIVVAVDTLGPTGQPGIGWLIRHDDTVSATDSKTLQGGKGERSDEVLSAVDTVTVEVDYVRSNSDIITASDVGSRITKNYFRRSDEVVTAVAAAEGVKQFWAQGQEVLAAIDTVSLALHKGLTNQEVVTAVDDVRVQLRQRPGVGLLLSPNRNGTYQDWNLFPNSGEEAWEDVVTEDSGTTKLYLSSLPGEAVTVGLLPPLIPVSSPHRISGLMVKFRVQGPGALLKTRFVWRDEEKDGESSWGPPGATWWPYYDWYPINPFGDRPWTSSDLLDMEVGVVNAGTVAVALDVIVVWVSTEPTPFRFPMLNASGKHSDWGVSPSTGADYDALRQDEGQRSYIQSAATDDQHTIRSTDSEVWIPDQFRIDKVNLKVRAKSAEGDETITPLVVDGGIDCWGPYHQPPLWPTGANGWPLELTSDEWRTFNVPFSSRPGFVYGESRWTLTQVLAAEWGVRNYSGGIVMVGHVFVEVFASLIPEEEHRLFPTANGTHNEWVVYSPGTGEDAYEDVNSRVPDDTSYLRSDATVRATLQTFQVTSTLDANLYGVRWRSRVRVEPSGMTDIELAPVLLKSGDMYVGRKLIVGVNVSQGGFVEVQEDFWVNPFDGKPWSNTALQSIECGILLLSGKADMSWCVLEAGTVPPREHSDSEVTCEFTDTGEANVARANADQLRWDIDKFVIGRGGFQMDNPAAVHPLELADDALADQVYEGTILRSSFDDKTAYYWIAIPPDVISDPVGEVMLMARVVSSNNVADVVGSYFPMAVAHYPAGFHTLRSIRVIRLALVYAGGPAPFPFFGFTGWP
jgi:hypothetical protein